MNAIYLSEVIKKYKNKWVALSSDNKTVVATGDTLNQVLSIANKKGSKKPSVFKVPNVENSFVG